MPARRGEPILRYIAANVRRLRIRQRFTQAALAEAADVDLTYVQRVERGAANTTVLVLVALARALDVPPSRLLRRADLEERPTGRPPSRRRGSSSGR